MYKGESTVVMDPAEESWEKANAEPQRPIQNHLGLEYEPQTLHVVPPFLTQLCAGCDQDHRMLPCGRFIATGDPSPNPHMAVSSLTMTLITSSCLFPSPSSFPLVSHNRAMNLTTFLMCDHYRSLSKGRRHYINKMTSFVIWASYFTFHRLI